MSVPTTMNSYDDIVELAPPHLDFVEDFHTALVESYEEHKHFLPWATSDPSIEDTRSNMKDAINNFHTLQNELRFIVKRRSDGRVVACVGLHIRDLNIPYFEIGYWTRSSETGKNYCTRSVRLIENYAVSQLKAKRLEIRTAISNLPSARVAEKAGYSLEATLQGDRLLPSGLLDGTYIFSKLFNG
jgi:ribosomal-protein-serine acetyltransferase